VSEYASDVVADLEVMVKRSLGRWDLPPDTRVHLLNLSENATFALEAKPGAGLVLRVHRVGYSSAEEIRSELAWINALREERVIETARPIPGRDGELVQRLESPSGRPSRHAVAFERLGGAEPRPEAAGIPWFERLGGLTAKMHRHARGWRLPAGFLRKRWDVDAMIGPHGYWGPWRNAIALDSSGSSVIEAALSLIRRRLEAYGSGPERFGLVHADLRLANLLADGARLRIIDFDDCGFSWFMYDFATAVSFIEGDPQVPALLEAWILGYRSVAPLSQADVAEIPTFIALRRILLCAWLASHSEVALASQLGAAYTAGTVAMAEELLRGHFLTAKEFA
jgi:Ser/Thr protein kinase RdoA (MazF antagonist)